MLCEGISPWFNYILVIDYCTHTNFRRMKLSWVADFHKLCFFYLLLIPLILPSFNLSLIWNSSVSGRKPLNKRAKALQCFSATTVLFGGHFGHCTSTLRKFLCMAACLWNLWKFHPVKIYTHMVFWSYWSSYSRKNMTVLIIEPLFLAKVSLSPPLQ